MVGSAIVNQLSSQSDCYIITKSRAELDLCNQAAVRAFFLENDIHQVYLSAAKVGGIYANDNYPAEFIYENLMIQSNVIHQAFSSGVEKLLFLGSSCIYPKLAQQPINESELLKGTLESSNEAYAIAKIAGIKLCESYNRQYGLDYRCIMPTNLYGENDNFHPENSHVIPGLLRRFHEAKMSNMPVINVWGSGRPRREFLHVSDLAEASIFLMNIERDKYKTHIQEQQSHVNIGSGTDISIAELAKIIAEVVGYYGEIAFDHNYKDGTPQKLLDTSLATKLGWEAKTSLEGGLQNTYQWFLKQQIFRAQ